MGFDPITMAATISKLTASGQIGYDGKTEKTYSFDGVVGDKPFQNAHVWISADIPSINSIKSITAVFGGEVITATKDELRLEIDNSPDGDTEAAYFGEYSAVMILKSDLSGLGMPPGLWVLYGGDMGYVSSVTFESGEVKPINPNFLPLDVLPRVEISEATATALLGAGTATVTAEEAARLDKMAASATPFLVTAKVQGMIIVNGLMQYVFSVESSTPFYVGTLAYVNDAISFEVYNFKKTDSGWDMSFKRQSIS